MNPPHDNNNNNNNSAKSHWPKNRYLPLIRGRNHQARYLYKIQMPIFVAEMMTCYPWERKR